MNPTFSVVVVLYNSTLERSLSLQSLNKIKSAQLKIYLWDNSRVPFSAEEIERLKTNWGNVSYFNTPENRSLAKIYNEVTRLSTHSDFLVLLDQDSSFDDNFFKEAILAIEKNSDINLFLPYIKTDQNIYSPGDFHFIKGKYWPNLITGRVMAKNKVAVSSGMIIRMKYLIENYPQFDERLKLYGIDSDFMIQYARKNSFFFVLNYNLQHQLSVNEKESIETKIFRFKDMRNSILIIAKKQSTVLYCFALLYVCYISVKSLIRYQSFKFIYPIK
jgi:GT2 family glycosyltransferase